MCDSLAMDMYYQGKKAEARALFVKACEKGHRMACENVKWVDRQK